MVDEQRVEQVEYFNVVVPDEPGVAYQLLTQLSGLGINLLAFHAFPLGPQTAQLVIFPEDADKMATAGRELQLRIEGPYHALWFRGSDALGAFARVHEKLAVANVNVESCTGFTDGRKGFAYIVRISPPEFPRAVAVLGL